MKVSVSYTISVYTNENKVKQDEKHYEQELKHSLQKSTISNTNTDCLQKHFDKSQNDDADCWNQCFITFITLSPGITSLINRSLDLCLLHCLFEAPKNKSAHHRGSISSPQQPRQTRSRIRITHVFTKTCAKHL